MMLLSPILSSSRRFARPAGAIRLVCCGVTLAAVLAAATIDGRAQGPSLADLAKKEQQRRKGVPDPKKVYTNKDLPAPATEPAPSAATQTEPTPIPAEPASAQAATAEQQKAAADRKDEESWRNRITAAREELRRNEVFLEALQSRVNALSADFVNRDDPYQRAKIGEDRQKALAEMDRVKRDIEEAKKSIETIEEEARKAGVPPGWLR
jgi:hypothetical protein